MKNPYKLGDVVRAKTANGRYYKAGAVGTVCQWNGNAPKEDSADVWVDFNHPDSPFPVYGDGIWNADVYQLELVLSKFTVVLERPERLDGLFMRTTWVTVTANSSEAAAEAARVEVCLGDDEPSVSKDDYTVRAVFAGAHTNLYEGA